MHTSILPPISCARSPFLLDPDSLGGVALDSPPGTLFSKEIPFHRLTALGGFFVLRDVWRRLISH